MSDRISAGMSKAFWMGVRRGLGMPLGWPMMWAYFWIGCLFCRLSDAVDSEHASERLVSISARYMIWSVRLQYNLNLPRGPWVTKR